MNKKQNSTTMPISIHSENLKAWNTHASAYIKYRNQILFQKWQGHEIEILEGEF